MPHFLSEINAAQLLCTEFPEPSWIVPSLIPEGLTLLAGPYKGSKSYWMLQLCRTVCQTHDVLYLALEDIPRRLKNRLMLQQGPPATARLVFVSQGGCEKWSSGGSRRIAAWLRDSPRAKLVVVDTLAKIRDPGTGNLYEADYEIMSRLKALADHAGIALIVVHHTRKLIDDNDPFNEISASTGLMGAADTIVLLKRVRGTANAVLWVTGRDVEEARHDVVWDEATMTWSMQPAIAEQASVDAKLVSWVARGPTTRAALYRAFSAKMSMRDLLLEVDRALHAGAIVEVRGKLLVPTPASNVIRLDG